MCLFKEKEIFRRLKMAFRNRILFHCSCGKSYLTKQVKYEHLKREHKIIKREWLKWQLNRVTLF